MAKPTSFNGRTRSLEAWTGYAVRRRRRGKSGDANPDIPIVDGTLRIVAWTDAAPTIEHGRLRHPEAERLLGGDIFCTQVALLTPADVVRAGGPAAWSSPWRCLALCPIELACGFDLGRLAVPLARTGHKCDSGPDIQAQAGK
jgi:hypothetical protein